MCIDFATLNVLCFLAQVLIPIANGSQGIELVTIADILRRAKVDVVIASVEKSRQILASTGTKVVADKLIKEAAESIYDLIILPVMPLKFLKNLVDFDYSIPDSLLLHKVLSGHWNCLPVCCILITIVVFSSHN